MSTEDQDISRLAEIPDPFRVEERAPLPSMRRPPAMTSPSRSRVRALRWTALVGALVWNGGWLFFDRRSDLGSLPASRLALGMAIPLVAGALALAAVVRRGPRGLGESSSRLAALAIGAPVLFVLGTWLGAAPGGVDGQFFRRALGCMAATAVLGAAPVLFGAWAFRHAFVAASAWRTAALGVACGALAAATMSVACSLGDVGHVLVGHGSMMVVLGISCALLARRISLA